MKAIKINIINKKMVYISFIFVILLTSTVFSGCLKNIGLGGEDYRWDVNWITQQDSYGTGDYGRRIEVQNVSRFYKFHIPIGYNPEILTPVVLCLHGGGGYPGAVRYQTDFDILADNEGFIIVYPGGHHRLWNDRLLFWNDGRTPKNDPSFSDIDDVGFISLLIDDLGMYFNIDENRIFATGISNGAMMSYRLASELSNKIAAIAPVAGQRAIGEFGQVPPVPVPIIHFHGILDEWAPYYGGKQVSSFFLEDFRNSVLNTTISWVIHNKCPLDPYDTFRIGNATCTKYGPGLNNSEVVLWTLEDGGHTWPGGKITKSEGDYLGIGVGPINHDISSMELIWKFFESLPKQ
ncbi:polyhydroxybutyrate depolymerase [Thermoplasmatales archaeon ex4572_165]|nr:MAG: polyhydroxybutyrate depolymerase [Thermoplasmatales archaeon ex4572_165]